MTQLVIYDSEAAEELQAQVIHYETQQAGLGLQMLQAVLDAEQRALRSPARFMVVHNANGTPVRRVLVERFPFILVFITLDTRDMRVVSVAHAKRKPRYWKRRIQNA
jgi:toxin ParE1/3/4